MWGRLKRHDAARSCYDLIGPGIDCSLDQRITRTAPPDTQTPAGPGGPTVRTAACAGGRNRGCRTRSASGLAGRAPARRIVRACVLVIEHHLPEVPRRLGGERAEQGTADALPATLLGRDVIGALPADPQP